MMKLRWSILCMAILGTTNSAVLAEQLSLQQALDRLQQEEQEAPALRTLYNQGAPNKSEEFDLAYTATSAELGKNLYYVVHTQPVNEAGAAKKGFLILSADDVAPALLGYSNTPFVADSLPDNVRVWLQGYEHSLKVAMAQGRPYQKNDAYGAAIPALVKTHWSQSGHYATLVQEKFNEAVRATEAKYSCRTVTGCVATALAQVMNYHKYPAQGQGSHSYQFETQLPDYTTDGRDTSYTYTLSLSADFSQSHYDWAHMATAYDYEWVSDTEYREVQNTAEECNAVAQLMYDCGVSVDMNYGFDGSGAWTEYCAVALYKYFGYDKSVHIEYRGLYTQSAWEQMVYNELANHRPVLYIGQTIEDGHAFICDGYSTDGLFHINWGWGGACDGYFSLWGENALQPDEDSDGYNIYNGIICGIKPDEGGALSPDKLVMANDFYLEYYDFENHVYVDIDDRELSKRPNVWINGGIANTSLRPIDCQIGLKFVNVDNSQETYIGANRKFTHLEISHWETVSVPTVYVMKAGTYRVYPVWADTLADVKDLEAWQEIRLTESQDPQTVTFTDDSKYIFEKYANHVLSTIRQDISYDMYGDIIFEGLMYAIPDKSIAKARLGLKFVNVDDPTYIDIEPSDDSCHPRTMSQIYAYNIETDCKRIPKIGTYRIIPVWADWEADYYDPENWQEIPGFITDETTITINDESPVRIIEDPKIEIKKLYSGEYPYINLKVEATQNNLRNVRISVTLYRRPKGSNSKGENLGTQSKALGALSRGQKASIKNMRISTTKLEKDYEYGYSLYYTIYSTNNQDESFYMAHRSYSTFSLSDDDVSGLETLTISDKETALEGLYNLWGQKVQDTTLPGIYISEGKKLIISK